MHWQQDSGYAEGGDEDCVVERQLDNETLKLASLRYLQARIAGGPSQLPTVTVLRRDATSDLDATIYDPVLCLILQGRKQTCIGSQAVTVGPGEALLVSHHLPVLSRVIEASVAVPYLAVIVTLDLALTRSLYDLVADVPLAASGARSLTSCHPDPDLLAAIGRSLEIAEQPLDARVLGPSILREIHYRLLISPAGGMLRSLLKADSHASRVARTIQVLRRDFRLALSVPDLARVAGMSETAFHQHFKSVTGTTPLQYQKDLRLIAARSLLVDKAQSVSEAAFAVGYESPTHFSRDYRRRFGMPPSMVRLAVA